MHGSNVLDFYILYAFTYEVARQIKSLEKRCILLGMISAPVGAPNAHLDLKSQHETLHTSSTHIYERFEHHKVFHMHVLRNLQLWLILACKTGHFVRVEHFYV